MTGVIQVPSLFSLMRKVSKCTFDTKTPKVIRPFFSMNNSFLLEYANFSWNLGPDYTLAFTDENKNIYEKKTPSFSVWVVQSLSLWKQSLGMSFGRGVLWLNMIKQNSVKKVMKKQRSGTPQRSGSCCICSIQYNFTVR